MIFDICAIGFVVLFSLVMMKKGGVRAILTLVSLILSLVVASVIAPAISVAMCNTATADSLEEVVYDVLIEQSANAEGEIPPVILSALDMAEEDIIGDVTKAVAEAICSVVIAVSVYVLVVIISNILFSLIVSVLDLATKLPVIHQMNAIVGLLCGLAASVVIVWIVSSFMGAVAASNNEVANIVAGSIVMKIMGVVAPF